MRMCVRYATRLNVGYSFKMYIYEQTLWKDKATHISTVLL